MTIKGSREGEGRRGETLPLLLLGGEKGTKQTQQSKAIAVQLPIPTVHTQPASAVCKHTNREGGTRRSFLINWRWELVQLGPGFIESSSRPEGEGLAACNMGKGGYKCRPIHSLMRVLLMCTQLIHFYVYSSTYYTGTKERAGIFHVVHVYTWPLMFRLVVGVCCVRS